MNDIWSFLLQTLTASGAAVLLLILKAMFRDKLSPRWQFAAWGVLGLALLLPAGRGGRYALLNWPFYVELLRSTLTGEYGALARVTAPVPLPAFALPQRPEEWLFALYCLGVLFFLVRYTVGYVRLRRALRRGRPAEDGPVRAAAERYHLPVCPAVEAEGLSSAFVCGVLQPVLALPAGVETDEKIILHELLHLKYHDAAWGLVICLFRCLHWCNPLLWYCADLAGNDLESLCDQRALERLEGEDRRDYGRILLDMADEKYARSPGTSSMANGGKNIRRRIEAIARFKRYPAGMGLVSACILLVLAAPLVVGVQAAGIPDSLGKISQIIYARTVPCTTWGGALDTYAKAVMEQRLDYRAMCAPLAEQDRLIELWRWNRAWLWENMGLNDGRLSHPEKSGGYRVYNLTQTGEGAYEGILVLELTSAPYWLENDKPYLWLTAQRVWAEREGERWVVIPQGEFQAFQAEGWTSWPSSCDQLPAWEYEAKSGDFTLRLRRQTSSSVNSYEQEESWLSSVQWVFSTVPQPGGSFHTQYHQHLEAEYTGRPEEKWQYTSLGASSRPIWGEAGRPELEPLIPTIPGATDWTGSSNQGDSQASTTLEGVWRSPVFLGGGGSSVGKDPFAQPSAYAVDFYVNGERAAELTLLPVEGGPSHD